MSEFALSLLVALTGWWFSTGVILWLVHRPEQQHRLIFGLSTVLMVLAFWGLSGLVDQWSPKGVVMAFCLALLLWGWLEMGYLMGFITGPQKGECPPGASASTRIRLGLGTCLWHELTLLAMVLVLALMSWNHPNQVALWAFTVLWLMRWSSKLNLVLGVRNYNRSWLPSHLAYVDSYIPKRPFNVLFPVSLCCGLLASFLLITGAMAASELPVMIGLALVGALAALGTLEHIFLMAPLGDATLWLWAAPSPGSSQAVKPGSHH